MSDGLPKVNVGGVAEVPLAAASQGIQAVTKFVEEKQISDKLSSTVKHPKLEAAYAKAQAHKELLLVALGLVLVFHGSQFKNIVLCTQLVVAFLFTRLQGSLSAIYEDLKKVQEKAEADAPAAQPEPAKESNEEKSKHAKKRDAKKAAEKTAASSVVDRRAHLEAAKKMLKALDSERLTDATKEVLLCVMACLLVIHGGLAQSVAVAHANVSAAAKQVEAFLIFEGFEDIEVWTATMVHFVLWMIMLPIAVLMGPLALILNVATIGASLVVEHGAKHLLASGKLSSFVGSQGIFEKGLFAGLLAVGTLWQVWTWYAGNTIGWYFNVVYFPAVIVEAIVSCF